MSIGAGMSTFISCACLTCLLVNRSGRQGLVKSLLCARVRAFFALCEGVVVARRRERILQENKSRHLSLKVPTSPALPLHFPHSLLTPSPPSTLLSHTCSPDPTPSCSPPSPFPVCVHVPGLLHHIHVLGRLHKSWVDIILHQLENLFL